MHRQTAAAAFLVRMQFDLELMTLVKLYAL